MPVFYNPKMRVNRDLSVLALRYLSSKAKGPIMVADPMAASGVRSIRFLLETDFEGTVFANDISPLAGRIMEENFKLNGIDVKRYRIHERDAISFLRERRGFGFDYIDLDPYGTPVPYIESCALSLKRGGFLGITATDTAPLSGTYPNTCRRRYGALPLRNEFKHEVGVRILIKKVVELSAQHDIAMKPVFSFSHLHYFKVFFIKDRGVAKVDGLLSQIGYLSYCFSCSYRRWDVDPRSLSQKCSQCGGKLPLAGPLWVGPLWDAELVRFMLTEAQDSKRFAKDTVRLLRIIAHEVEVPAVGFYSVSKLCERLGIPRQPPIRDAIEIFQGVRTHFAGDGVRTPLDHREVIKRAERLKGIIESRRGRNGSTEDA